jgi:hypothetical protein
LVARPSYFPPLLFPSAPSLRPKQASFLAFLRLFIHSNTLTFSHYTLHVDTETTYKKKHASRDPRQCEEAAGGGGGLCRDQ